MNARLKQPRRVLEERFCTMSHCRFEEALALRGVIPGMQGPGGPGGPPPPPPIPDAPDDGENDDGEDAGDADDADDDDDAGDPPDDGDDSDAPDEAVSQLRRDDEKVKLTRQYLVQGWSRCPSSLCL